MRHIIFNFMKFLEVMPLVDIVVPRIRTIVYLVGREPGKSSCQANFCLLFHGLELKIWLFGVLLCHWLFR